MSASTDSSTKYKPQICTPTIKGVSNYNKLSSLYGIIYEFIGIDKENYMFKFPKIIAAESNVAKLKDAKLEEAVSTLKKAIENELKDLVLKIVELKVNQANAEELKDLVLKISELKANEAIEQELKNVESNNEDLKKLVLKLLNLKAAQANDEDLKKLVLNLLNLKDAQSNDEELKELVSKLAELKLAELKAAQANGEELKDFPFNLAKLKDEFKTAQSNDEELKDFPFNLADLKAAQARNIYTKQNIVESIPDPCNYDKMYHIKSYGFASKPNVLNQTYVPPLGYVDLTQDKNVLASRIIRSSGYVIDILKESVNILKYTRYMIFDKYIESNKFIALINSQTKIIEQQIKRISTLIENGTSIVSGGNDLTPRDKDSNPRRRLNNLQIRHTQ